MTDPYKQLREALDKATPGPWVAVNYGNFHPGFGERDEWYVDTPGKKADIYTDEGIAPNRAMTGDPRNEWDMKYVAAANPQTITALLNELDAWKKDAISHDRELATLSKSRDKALTERDALLSSHDALQARHDILTSTVLDALARHGVTYVDDPGEAIDSLMAGKVREVEALRETIQRLENERDEMKRALRCCRFDSLNMSLDDMRVIRKALGEQI